MFHHLFNILIFITFFYVSNHYLSDAKKYKHIKITLGMIYIAFNACQGLSGDSAESQC